MEDILSAIDSIADLVPKPVSGDYIGADGLVYCAECNTPKQCRVTIFGQDRIMPCICKCGAEKAENEKQLKTESEFAERVKKLRLAGFPETNMQNWTFGNDDCKNQMLSQVARKYADNFDRFKKVGTGLLLYGGVGTGKTFAAACIANFLIDKGIPVLMTSFPRIANTVQGMTTGRQEYYDSFNDYILLIIDDLSAERKTEYMQEIVYNVIDTRCNSGLPMIITSNITAQELKNPVDTTSERIFSRLLEKCHPIEIKGTDRRRQKLKNDFEQTRKLLGI
ncbi:MAG: ATP-binding protein [Oscillospiraceae bacterium]|nr:ATP-binding protein [Oscillospiraceae bacterium]